MEFIQMETIVGKLLLLTSDISVAFALLCIVKHAASPIDYLYFSLQYMGLYVFNWPIFSSRWLKGYIYSSCYHHQIGSIHLPSCYHIPCGCVPETFVTSYSVTYCIYAPGKREFVFIIIVQFMMSTNIRMRFGLQIVLVCLYRTPSYHHCANLYEGFELIKCLSAIFCRVVEQD